jgi:hypothetical protein
MKNVFNIKKMPLNHLQIKISIKEGIIQDARKIN